MKSLLEYLCESPDIILESTPEDVKAMKKWLKSHQAKKLKVVGDEITVAGKTGAAINEITFDGSEKELPDFVKFDKTPYSATLEINGKGLETLKGFPAPGAAAYMNLYELDKLSDFDLDFSENDAIGSISFYDCDGLKSFSGFKTLKTKYPMMPYIYLYRCKNLVSLKDFQEGDVRLCKVIGCGIKSLEGYKTYPGVFNKSEGTDIKVEECPNLVSLDLEGDLAPRVLEVRKCPKLKKVGKFNFKSGKIDYVDFWKSGIDERFLEDFIELAPMNEKYCHFNLRQTGIKEDSDVVKKIIKKYPNCKIDFD